MAKDIFKSLENEISVYRDNLMGYYNANNLYMINPEIIENLIEMPKVIDKFIDNKVFCSCYLVGHGTISFEIDISKDNTNYVSTMYLVENTTRMNGYMCAAIKTPLVQFVAKEEKDFIQRVIYAFNLCEDATVLEQPSDEEKLKSYIYQRKSYNQNMFESIKGDCNKEFKTLLDTQLNYLKNTKNPFTKEVLQNFKDKENELKGKYLKIGKTLDYFAMYQLLMSCIESTLKKNPDYDRYYKEYSKNLYIATQFALRAIRNFNIKFKNGAYKKLDATKSNSLVKIMTNKEKLTTDTKENTNTVIKLGDVLEDGYLDSIRQRRGFRRGMHRFRELQQREHDERCKICGDNHNTEYSRFINHFCKDTLKQIAESIHSVTSYVTDEIVSRVDNFIANSSNFYQGNANTHTHEREHSYQVLEQSTLDQIFQQEDEISADILESSTDYTSNENEMSDTF